MNRRAFVCGSAAILSGLAAGCVDGLQVDRATTDDEGSSSGENDEESTADEGGEQATVEPETVCETVDAILESIVAGEYDVAASFAPTEYVEEAEREDVRRQYEELDVPDGTFDRSCDEIGSDDAVAESIAMGLDGDVAIGDANKLEIEIGSDERRRETTVTVFAAELDGDWYGWVAVSRTVRAEAQAGIEFDFDERDEELTVTVVAIGNADYVTLGGDAAEFGAADGYGPNGADDLSGVELGVGDSVTVDGTDLTGGDVDGTVTAIAVIEDEDVRTTVGSIEVEIAATA
ncbi:hypothetical protein [Halosolutus gelatinilyticus]|uniref:hypothetical protein n=1 Tax=Halosolutus gelatinilyticus TaxID=2931975 RepID=UPI001FF1048A|nr:hypothetical protein [Halosolutus gelatinilyticus]